MVSFETYWRGYDAYTTGAGSKKEQTPATGGFSTWLGSSAPNSLIGGTGLVGGSVSPTYKYSYTPVNAQQNTFTPTYAPAWAKVFSPQVDLSPQISVASPQSQQYSKKEMAQEYDISPTASPAIAVAPTQSIPVTTNQTDTTTSDIFVPLIIVGAVAGLGYVLLKGKKGKKK